MAAPTPNLEIPREIQFVEAPLKHFTCPICLEVLTHPFLTECCGNHFCDKCISSVKQRRNECPLCKARPVYGIVDKHFKRELNEAKVYCSLRSQGCDWTGGLENLNNHLSLGQKYGQCKHVEVICPNKKCGHKLPRHKMKRHMNNVCRYRPFTCQWCGHNGVYGEVVTFHYQNCSLYPVTCPNECSTGTMKRNQLKGHHNVCPNAIVFCPFHGVGCRVTTKRCKQKDHVESHAAHHQVLITNAVTELQKNVKLADSKSQITTSHVASRISTVENKCAIVEHDLCSFIADETRIERNRQLDETRDNFEHLRVEVVELSNNLVDMSLENQQLKSRVDFLQVEVGQLEEQLTTSNQQMANMKKELKQLHKKFEVDVKQMIEDEVATKLAPLQETVSQQQSVDHWIKGYKLIANEMKRRNWRLYLVTMAEAATQFPTPVLPVIVRVSGYKDAKLEGKSLDTSEVYFGTDCLSRLYLSVSFNVNGFMSVAVKQCYGYTGLPQNLIVTLLNQAQNTDHYTKDVWSASDGSFLDYAGKFLTNNFYTRSYGKLSISHDELERPRHHYVVNDTLYFEVSTSDSEPQSYNCCLQ